MTDLLKHAFEQVRYLPAAEQNRIAESLLNLVRLDQESDVIPPEHLAAVNEGFAQLARGEYFTEADVEEMLEKALA